MKKVLIGLGAVIVVLVIAALVVPMLIPVDTYKGRLLAAIQDATGREARIDGDFGFSILPNVQFTAGKVSLANAKGASPDKMVTLDNLKVRVAVMPLLSGNVQIDSFVLDKPVINLSVDKNGVPNWQFAKKEAAARRPSPPRPHRAARSRQRAAARPRCSRASPWVTCASSTARSAIPTRARTRATCSTR